MKERFILIYFNIDKVLQHKKIRNKWNCSLHGICMCLLNRIYYILYEHKKSYR